MYIMNWKLPFENCFVVDHFLREIRKNFVQSDKFLLETRIKYKMNELLNALLLKASNN